MKPLVTYCQRCNCLHMPNEHRQKPKPDPVIAQIAKRHIATAVDQGIEQIADRIMTQPCNADNPTLLGKTKAAPAARLKTPPVIVVRHNGQCSIATDHESPPANKALAASFKPAKKKPKAKRKATSKPSKTVVQHGKMTKAQLEAIVKKAEDERAARRKAKNEAQQRWRLKVKKK